MTEALCMEVEPLGIKVCVIEPGYFRTGFLNPGARMFTEKRIKDYDETIVGQIREFMNGRDNNQLGDIEKGCKVIYDEFITRDYVPIRLVLGSDCVQSIKTKCEQTLQLLEEQRKVASSTDYPDGQ